MISPFEAAILGLIRSQDRSSYDVMRLFSEGGFFWSGSPGAVYPAVKRLQKKELLSTVESNKAQVYTLTEKGLKALRIYATNPVSTVRLLSDVATLRLTIKLSVLLDDEQRALFYTAQIEELSKAIGILDRRMASNPSIDRLSQELAYISIENLKSYRKMIKKLKKSLQEKASEA